MNRLAEEYGKDHKQELTDEIVLEKVAEAAKNKVHIAKSKSGIVVKELMMWQSGSPDAVIQYREMRLSDLLQEEEDFRFTARIVLI